MSERCPHGAPRPASATTYTGQAVPRGPDPVVRLIHDWRECPDCLREQIAKANALLNEIFLRRGIIDAATYAAWTVYVQRYDP